MISVLSTNGNVINYAGLSTDTKPTTDLATGSFFLEVDTSKAFFFDEVCVCVEEPTSCSLQSFSFFLVC